MKKNVKNLHFFFICGKDTHFFLQNEKIIEKKNHLSWLTDDHRRSVSLARTRMRDIYLGAYYLHLHLQLTSERINELTNERQYTINIG